MNILNDYDHDQMYPVYGFGGLIHNTPHAGASHCFALNGDIFRPEVKGVSGILHAYNNSLSRVKLAGPTYFNKILEYVNGYAKYSEQELSQCNQKYTILLILTDGIINDMAETIKQVVIGSDLPLSVVIIGVGSADFSAMEELDGDVTPLYSTILGRPRNRDIVQFVPFNDFKADPTRLAKEVLQEIPGQLIDYFVGKNIRPNPSSIVEKKQLQIQQQMKHQMAAMMHVQSGWCMERQQQLI